MVTPTLSVALTVSVIVPLTVEPFVGAVTVTAGAAVSAHASVETITTVLADEFPVASNASTASV